MRGPCAIALGVFLAACTGDGVRHQPMLVVSPPHLDFPDTYVGAEHHLRLALGNDSGMSLSASLAVSDPFSVDRTGVSVPNGVTVVNVTFRPTAAGTFSTDLVVSNLFSTSRVHVTGRGLADADCTSVDTCTGRAFDPAQGKCVDHPLADGTACHNACVLAGKCLEGVCRGQEISCDDGNLCTHDSCDPDKGCVHTDGTNLACPVPADPCQVATCDPVNGCGTALAPDGTSCDASDCTTTYACQSGQCVASATPEGATCPATPCQDEGICHNHQCVRAPPVMLKPEWTRNAKAGMHVNFRGVADDDGNLYWSECTESDPETDRCDILSVDAHGRLRWRVRADGTAHCGYQPGLLLLNGDTVVSSETNNWLEAFDAQTGALKWKLDVLNAVTDGSLATWMLDKSYVGVQIEPIVDTGKGVIVGFVESYPSCMKTGITAGPPNGLRRIITGEWFIAVDLATGTLRWKEPVDRVMNWPPSVVSDENGDIFTMIVPDGWWQSSAPPDATLESFDGLTGTPRWATNNLEWALAAYDGLLLTEDGQSTGIGNVNLRSASTGGLLATMPGYFGLGTLDEPSPVFDGVQIYDWGRETVTPRTLTGMDPSSFATWSLRYSDSWEQDSQAELTSRGAVFVSSTGKYVGGNWEPDSHMYEFDSGGREIFVCPVEPTCEGPMSLSANHWVGSDAVGSWSKHVLSVHLSHMTDNLPPGWLTFGGNGRGGFRPR